MTILNVAQTAVALLWTLGVGSSASFALANKEVKPAESEEPQAIQVMFVNQTPNEVIDLYWVDPRYPADTNDRNKLVARIAPRGGWEATQTFVGHEFAYELYGKVHYVNPRMPNNYGEEFIVLSGDKEDYRVRCEVSVNSKSYTDFFEISVRPYWSPRGASRFLELVREKYYDGVAINRVLPNYIAQFGIAKDYEVRSKQQEIKILDDFPNYVRFDPGVMSFAGSGPDSRSTEVFAVMPGINEDELVKFGQNIWEVPFAKIMGDLENSALTKFYAGYGSSPDSTLIYEEDGYTKYLPKKFPKLDYIDRCYVVEEAGIDALSEGEF